MPAREILIVSILGIARGRDQVIRSYRKDGVTLDECENLENGVNFEMEAVAHEGDARTLKTLQTKKGQVLVVAHHWRFS